MKGITAFALNNSRTVIMTLLLVILGGMTAFIRLPKLEDPLITIREALRRSINMVAIKLGWEEVGIETVAQTARQMGIQTEIERFPSTTIGAGSGTVVVENAVRQDTRPRRHQGQDRDRPAAPPRAAFLSRLVHGSS